MLETDFRISQGLSYVILFFSFMIAVFLIPTINGFLAGRFQGLILYLITHLVAFVLAFFVIPKILVMIFNKE